MNEFRAMAADRYLTWQEGDVRRARVSAGRSLGAAPYIALLGALALALGLGVSLNGWRAASQRGEVVAQSAPAAPAAPLVAAKRDRAG